MSQAEYDELLKRLQELYDRLDRANEHEAIRITKEITELRRRLAELKKRIKDGK
jgi:polyhydroxyalkanoate synthesis regulator phasin